VHLEVHEHLVKDGKY
jgi:hypothetical protein